MIRASLANLFWASPRIIVSRLHEWNQYDFSFTIVFKLREFLKISWITLTWTKIGVIFQGKTLCSSSA